MSEQIVKMYIGAKSINPTIIIWRPFAVISFLLLFTLSFESIPLPVQAQILPFTSLLAMLLLPFVVIQHVCVTPLFKIVMLFAVFVLLHSVVTLFMDTTILGAERFRMIAWARQVIALIMGLSVFFVLRRTLIPVSDRFVVYAVIVGTLPALALGLLNVCWGFSGNVLAGNIVSDVRSMIVPRGFTSPLRASGLSMEPSHFAFYLAIIVIPTIFSGFMVLKKRLLWFTLLILSLITFMWTVSVTGFIALLGLVLTGVMLGPRRDFFIIAMIGLLVSIAGFVIVFPDNYAVVQTRSLLSSSGWTISITSRFYSTFGPVINSLSSYTVLGYGLGGTSMHLNAIIPAFAQADIVAASWEGMPNLKSLIGRLLAETGLMGLSLFFMIVAVSLQEVRNMNRGAIAGLEIPLLIRIAKLALFAFLSGSIVGYGSFALPYFWFWLAVIDSRYIRAFCKVYYN